MSSSSDYQVPSQYIKLSTLWFHEKIFCKSIRIWVEWSPNLTLFLSMFSLIFSSGDHENPFLNIIYDIPMFPTLMNWGFFYRRFSIFCSALKFPFCICRLFGHFHSVLSFLSVTASNHSRQTSYSAERCHLLINRAFKMGGEQKRKLLVLVCPSSWLIALGPLHSWLTRNISRTLTLSNGLLNTVEVFLIHKPIIRFTFSGRRIMSFAPA